MNRSSLIRLAIALIAVALWASAPAHAQYPGYVNATDDTGMPNYGSFISSSIDSINMTNMNLMVHIPLLSRKGRGIDYNVYFEFQSSYWVSDSYVVTNPSQILTYYYSRPDGSAGPWLTRSNIGGSLDWTEQIYDLDPCPYNISQPPQVLVRSNWVYISADGAKHQLPLRKIYNYSGLASCTNGVFPENLVAQTDDGHIQVDITNDQLTDHSGIKITRRDGTRDGSGAVGFIQEDTNGNFFSPASTNNDTLGRTPFSTQANPSNSHELFYTYTDSNGNTQTVTVDTAVFNVTATDVEQIQDSSGTSYNQFTFTWPITMITKITLANGLSYTFAYDDPNNAGQLTKVTLPTGGYVKYVYGQPGTSTLGSLVAKHVSEDGVNEQVWTYSYATAGSHIVTDPLGNSEKHVIGGNCYVSGFTDWANQMSKESSVEYRNASGTLLKTVTNDWACDTGAIFSAQPGANMPVDSVGYTPGYRNPRVIRTAVTLADTNQVTKTETDYADCFTNVVFYQNNTDCRQNPTEIREYAYGTGSPGALMRKTDISYWHNQTAGSVYLSGHIWNRVYEKDVYDGPTSALMASTQYNYDSTTITSTSSVPQHDSTFNSSYTLRGNVTQIKRKLISTGAWLTTTNYYNDVGNLIQTTDPGGHSYYLSYTDNFTDGTNRNSQAFLTSVSGPTTNGVSHVEGKQYYWNTGLTAAVCGQNAPSPAACTNSYSPSSGSPVADYAKYTYDGLGRPLTITHGDGGATSFSFTEPSSPSPSSRISVSSSSAIDSSNTLTNSVVIDGLGRVIQTQLTSDPAGTDKVDTVYDIVGRVSTASNPYRSTSDATYGITTNVYDGLGRVVQLIPPDGSTSANYVSTFYSGNTVTVTDQAGKQRRSFTDALGRLIEVDEPGSLATAGGSGTASTSGSEQSLPGAGATSGAGSVTISGTERSTVVSVDTGQQQQVCTTVDCGGNCVHWEWQEIYENETAWDTGAVTITVNGHADSANYDQDSTSANIATALRSAINADSSAPVTAGGSGSTVTLAAKVVGVATNYSLSVNGATGDPVDFGTSSFWGSPSGSALTGGSNGPSPIYDSGSVWIAANGHTDTVSYGSSSTGTTVATALASAINADSSASVTASASATSITLTAKTIGAGTNYSVTSGSSTSQPSSFSSPSFAVSAGGLSGGNDGTTGSLATPLVTLYTYDALNNLICVEQHGNTTGTGCSAAQSYDSSSAWRVRRFQYDSLGRMTSSTNPESGTSTFTYDSDGNVLTKTSPKPNQTSSSVTVTTTLTYDALHRVLTKSFNDSSTPTVTIAYDGTTISGCSPTLTAALPIGRRTSMCDAAGWEAWSYDSRGHVIAERRNTNSVTKSTAYTYNFHGGVTSITYPSGRTVSYTYNAAGQTGSASDVANSITYASSAAYNPAGALTSLQEGANLVSTMYYNNRLQPCRISVKNSGSAPSSCTDSTTGNVMDFTYGFNYGAADNGNVQSIANNITTARSQTYTYDELNRVSTAKTTATSGTYSWGLQFGYDPWANLLSTSVTQGSAYAMSVTADGSNRIHSTMGSFTYDAAGNLTADPVNSSYTYNAEGELTSAAGVTYTYDGDGSRVKKSSSKLYWYGLGSDPLSESDASGNLTNEYIFLSGARIAMLTLSGGAVNYYIADHLGSSRIVTNASGTVLDDSDFYPYGGERSYSSSSGNNYKFTGKERDTESGLDDFAARFYTSNYGRFLSPDDSKYIHPSDPQTLNLYSYVANNPINAVDPTGHDPDPGLRAAQYKPMEHAGYIDSDLGSGAGSGPSEGNSGTDDGNDTATGSDTKTYLFRVTDTLTDADGKVLSSITSAESVQATNVSDAYFSITSGLQSGPREQTLDFTTIRGGPKNSAEWDVKWNLSQKSKSGGYIVQEITNTDPDGDVVMHFWEAWQVKKGSTLTVYNGKYPADDYFINLRGISATAEARFYEGLKLPSSFKANNKQTNAGILRSSTIDPHLSLDNATEPVRRTFPNN